MKLVFDELCACPTSMMTFAEAYRVMYENLMGDGVDVFIERMRERMQGHFEQNILHNLSDSDSQIRAIGNIMREYVRYVRTSYPVFRITERFSHGFRVCDHIKAIFVAAFKARLRYDEVVGVFFASFDRLIQLGADAKDDEEYQDMIDCSRLIQVVFGECVLEFTKDVCDHVRSFCLSFVERRESLSCREFLECSVSLFSFMKEMSEVMFECCTSRNDVCQTVYDVIIARENQMFRRCVEFVSERCRERDNEYMALLYRLIDFREPPSEVLMLVSRQIKLQLNQEVLEIPLLGSTIRWYLDMAMKELCDNPAIQLHLKNDIADLLGSNKRAVFRELLRYIISKARVDGDLSEIIPVLFSLSSKTEFELQYVRAAAQRLVPVSEKQIKREQDMLRQVKNCSENYDLKGLGELLREALASLELHIGNVVTVSSSLWPFKPPYPLPVALSPFADEITAKYRQIFPNRMIRFPIDAWELNMRNTVTKTLIVGNGIQAEVLLYMNDHASISDDSLEPFIPASVVSAAMKTLTTTRYPIFVKTGEAQYKLNQEFKAKVPHIKLPRPVISEHATLNSQLGRMRDNTIDSEIVRIMKQERALQIHELESRVRDVVSNRFTVDHASFQARLNSLANMNYVEIASTGDVIYTP